MLVQGVRRIPVQVAKRIQGSNANAPVGGVRQYIPLRVNTAGVMPIIFAQAIVRFGNWFISFVCGILYNINLKDTQCGYRCFKSSIWDKIKWKEERYSMDTEMIVNVGIHKLKYSEIKPK
jgi:preprotein translocase subunit SecY